MGIQGTLRKVLLHLSICLAILIRYFGFAEQL